MGMFGAFAAAGALQGLGEGMQHRASVQEALDTSYKNRVNQDSADAVLDKAKQDDMERRQLALKNSNQANDKAIQGYNSNKIQAEVNQVQANPAGNAGAQPVPGVPQQLGGQPQAQQGATQPPTADNSPIKPTSPTLQQTIPQPATGGLNSPQGSSVELTPMAAPAPTDIPPTAPAANIAGKVDDANTMQTKDPFDVVANQVGHLGPNGINTNGFNQAGHDLVMESHAKFPNLSPLQIAANVKDYLQGNHKDFDTFNNFMLKQDEQAAKAGATAPVLLNDAGIANRAKQFGVPAYKDSVFFSLPEKQQEAEFLSQQKAFQKDYDSNVPNIKDAQQHLGNITSLLQSVGTGGANALPGSQAFRTAVDANAAELQKEMAYVTLRSRPSSGFSRVTNADLAMFTKASPNFSIPNEANYAIATGLAAQKQDELEYYNFKQNWLDAYHHLDNAMINKAWDNYKDNNPIFDPTSKPTNPKLNENRQSPQEYFADKDMNSILATQGNNDKQNAAAKESNAKSPIKQDDSKAPDYSKLWTK